MQAFAKAWHGEGRGHGTSAPQAPGVGHLNLIAAHPDGCTEAFLASENIPAEVLIELRVAAWWSRETNISTRKKGPWR
jgi:hypothetical protein